MRRILSVKLKDAISQRRRMHQVLDNALQLVSPRAKIANTRQRVDDLNTRGWVAAQNHIRIKQASLLGLAQTLQAFDPLAVLGRGYAVVTRTDTGRLVNTVDLVDKGDLLNVRVQDGRFKAAVQGKAKRLTKRSEG
jgi:exodeoxyribonuclease VII large subunit